MLFVTKIVQHDDKFVYLNLNCDYVKIYVSYTGCTKESYEKIIDYIQAEQEPGSEKIALKYAFCITNA